MSRVLATYAARPPMSAPTPPTREPWAPGPQHGMTQCLAAPAEPRTSFTVESQSPVWVAIAGGASASP
jgi:hypothetical protein